MAMKTVLNLRNQLEKFANSRKLSFTSNKLAPIKYAERNNSGTLLKVEFTDDKANEYPSSFLQDNCTCPQCFHPSSLSRTRKMTQLNLQNVLEKVEFNLNQVKCTWGDGHEGVFTENWLFDRRFTTDNINYLKTGLRDDPILVESSHKLHTANFNQVLNDKSVLNDTLMTLCKVGVVLIQDGPLEVGGLRKLVDKIGFIRQTHYGHEFTVKSEKNAANLAYTSIHLCVHTDLPYYVYPPGVQLLHCIKQFVGDGGRSHLVDGFLVADKMLQAYPKEFKTLCKVPLEFSDVGKDFIEFNKVHHSPTFVLEPRTGKVTRIVYSNQQLSSYQPIPIDQVDEVYHALKVFTDLCYDPKNLIQFKLNDGEMLVFDNWRYLHGREGFDPSAGDRHLEGCYVDWDEIFSRIRILQEKS